jgi:hypothetical protein
VDGDHDGRPDCPRPEAVIAMGMKEGMAAAMGQIDGLLTTERV